MKTSNIKTEKEYYFIECTDIYQGEANYSWVKRFKVLAASPQAALTKVKQEMYYAPIPQHKTILLQGDELWGDVGLSRFFVSYFEDYHSQLNLKEI